MVRRAYGRVVDEGSHRDMHEAAVTHDGIEERAASLAVCVVGVFLPEDHKLACTFGYGELRALYSRVRLDAEPVVRRQLKQWQFAASRNSSATAYSTAPQ